MMLAMFAGEHRHDWDNLLPAVMMAYRSSVHESTGFWLYPLMFGEECTLPMDVGLPRHNHDMPDHIKNPYPLWVRDTLKVAFDQVRRHAGQAVRRQKRLYDKRAVKRVFVVGDCCGGLLSTVKEMQVRLTMDGTLSSRITGVMGRGCSITPGFTDSNDSLSRYKENPAPEGFGVNSPASSPTPPVLWCVTLRRGPPLPHCQMPSCSGMIFGSRPLHNILWSHYRIARGCPKKT